MAFLTLATIKPWFEDFTKPYTNKTFFAESFVFTPNKNHHLLLQDNCANFKYNYYGARYGGP